MATTAVIPLIPLLATARGASPALVGAVAASTAVLPLLLGVWAGVGSDVFGARRMVQTGILLYAAGAVSIATAPTVSLIMAGAALWGLANNIVFIACQTSVAQASTPEHRDRNYGAFAFWQSVGQLLGPLGGGFLAERYSLPAAFYASAALGISAFLFASRISIAGSVSANDVSGRFFQAHAVYRAAWGLTRRGEVRFILWIAFLIIFAWSIKSSFFPLYLQAVGLPKSEIGLIFSCMGGGSMAIRPLLGALTDRFGRRPVLLGAAGLGMVAIGVVPLLREFWPLALAATAAGVAWGITQPLTMSLMAGNVQPHERGLALSLRISGNRLAEVVSPIAFGTLVTLTGLGGAFAVAAVALMVCLAVVGRDARSEVFAGRSGQTLAQAAHGQEQAH